MVRYKYHYSYSFMKLMSQRRLVRACYSLIMFLDGLFHKEEKA